MRVYKVSSEAEIREVYEAEIADKSRAVRRKYGERPFYDGFGNMRIFDVLDTDPCDTKEKESK